MSVLCGVGRPLTQNPSRHARWSIVALASPTQSERNPLVKSCRNAYNVVAIRIAEKLESVHESFSPLKRSTIRLCAGFEIAPGISLKKHNRNCPLESRALAKSLKPFCHSLGAILPDKSH